MSHFNEVLLSGFPASVSTIKRDFFSTMEFSIASFSVSVFKRGRR